MSSRPPTNLEVARSVRLRPITEVAAEMGLDQEHVELFGWHKAKVELQGHRGWNAPEDWRCQTR
jgi:formate--tetrahydrofolate ligase